jgi:hypothetical protein
MELVANVWPVVDRTTGIVLRFFMRAYAMEAPDSVISSTLRALSICDFRLATMFTIPKRFRIVSEHGELPGAVTSREFAECQAEIMTTAFPELERQVTERQGIVSAEALENVHTLVVRPRFPPNPYIVTTTLWEMPDGRLVPEER